MAEVVADPAGYSGIDLDSFEILDWTNKRCREHGWGVDGFETPIGSLLSHMAGPWAQGQMARDAARERAATPSPKKRWFGR